MNKGRDRQAAKARGERGEQIAADYLVRQGWSIVTRNYRTRGGEIDLIAYDLQQQLVFVEVRTRKTPYSLEAACESVDFVKQRRLRYAAHGYLQQTDGWLQACRFDLIAIVLEDDDQRYRLRHLRSIIDGGG